MNIKDVVFSSLREKTDEIQEIMGRIQKLQEKKKEYNSEIIEKEIEPEIGALRFKKNTLKNTALSDLETLLESKRVEVMNSNRLDGKELTEDAKLFSFPGLLTAEDVEAIMDRNATNHTMLQLAMRYASQNKLQIRRVYHSGRAEEMQLIDAVGEAGNFYIRNWIDNEKAYSMLKKFFPD